MPANDLEQAVIKGGASNPTSTGDGPASNTLNNPKLDDQGKPTKRAITDPNQAHSIAKSIVDAASQESGGRIPVAAIISEKYNGGPPFSTKDLMAAEQGWRANFSTNYLASIIDRVVPQILDPLHKSDTITHSTLPASIEDSANKSRKFCEEVTRTIRRWNQWKDFTRRLAQEVVLYGNAIPAWIDHKTEWRPFLWEYNQAFMPDGTGQHASTVSVVVFRQSIPLHKFLKLFENKSIAEKAGYNVENCIKVANNEHSSTNHSQDNSLDRENQVREAATLSGSFKPTARTVDLFHIVVQDYTGEVDLWTVTQDNGTEIRNLEAMQDEMQDAISLYTFQCGNGKFYGSKGLGRLLVNIHIAIERGRCLAQDQGYLAGLIGFETDDMSSASIQAKVRHPFFFVKTGLKVLTERIEFDAQAYELVDNKLSQIGESIAGAFIPPNLEQQGSSSTTKIEAAQKAERELAVKEGVLGRFFDHASDMISTMQRKLFAPINLREGKRAWENKQEQKGKGIMVLVTKVFKLLKKAFSDRKDIAPDVETQIADEEAVSLVVTLLDAGLSVDEIAMLALSPSAQNNADEGSDKDNRTLQYIAANRINPHVDQRAATDMEARISIGEDRAKRIVIPVEDPNVQAIAVRQQLIEFSEMLDGVPMPVASTDRHDIHLQVLDQKMPEIMPAIQKVPTPQLITTAELAIIHYEDHVNSDTTMPDDAKKAKIEAIKPAWQLVQQQKAALAKAAQDQAAAAGTTGPDGQPLSPDQQRQSIHPDDAKLHLEIKDRELRERELNLKQQDQDHQQAADAIKLQQDNMKIVQKAAQDTSELGQREADRDQQAALAAAPENKP